PWATRASSSSCRTNPTASSPTRCTRSRRRRATADPARRTRARPRPLRPSPRLPRYLAAVEERLQKVLARAGVASRREAERLIAEGRVTVNGRVIREFGVKVDLRMDEIRVDTIEIRRSAAQGDRDRVYLLLNKPKGVLCTVKDTH